MNTTETTEVNKSVIWKFPLNVGKNIITVPGDHIREISYRMVAYKPAAYAEWESPVSVWVQIDNPNSTNLIEIELEVIGTGELFDSSNLQHIGSAVNPYGFVWHVFQSTIISI